VVLHTRDDVSEIGKRIDAARLAGRDEGVQPGDAHAGLEVADEEVVLAAERWSNTACRFEARATYEILARVGSAMSIAPSYWAGIATK
jgi:hypothetical protein